MQYFFATGVYFWIITTCNGNMQSETNDRNREQVVRGSEASQTRCGWHAQLEAGVVRLSMEGSKFLQGSTEAKIFSKGLQCLFNEKQTWGKLWQFSFWSGFYFLKILVIRDKSIAYVSKQFVTFFSDHSCPPFCCCVQFTCIFWLLRFDNRVISYLGLRFLSLSALCILPTIRTSFIVILCFVDWSGLLLFWFYHLKGSSLLFTSLVPVDIARSWRFYENFFLAWGPRRLGVSLATSTLCPLLLGRIILWLLKLFPNAKMYRKICRRNFLFALHSSAQQR